MDQVLVQGLKQRQPGTTNSPFEDERSMLTYQPRGVYACLSNAAAAYWGVEIHNNTNHDMTLIAFCSDAPSVADPCDWEHGRVLTQDVPASAIIGHKRIRFADVASPQQMAECLALGQEGEEKLIRALAQHTQNWHQHMCAIADKRSDLHQTSTSIQGLLAASR